jgi:hypothetical protein
MHYNYQTRSSNVESFRICIFSVFTRLNHLDVTNHKLPSIRRLTACLSGRPLVPSSLHWTKCTGLKISLHESIIDHLTENCHRWPADKIFLKLFYNVHIPYLNEGTRFAIPQFCVGYSCLWNPAVQLVYQSVNQCSWNLVWTLCHYCQFQRGTFCFTPLHNNGSDGGRNSSGGSDTSAG